MMPRGVGSWGREAGLYAGGSKNRRYPIEFRDGHYFSPTGANGVAIVQ